MVLVEATGSSQSIPLEGDDPVASPRHDSPAVSQTHRVVTSLAAIGLVGPAFAVWSGIIETPAAGVVAVCLSLVGMALAVTAATARTQRRMVWVDVAILVAAVAALVAWSATVLIANPSYGTDEAAYVQYAARLFLHGTDPYKTNLAPALNVFGVPLQYATYLTNGGIASGLGYPGWAVLLTAPFVEITGGVQSVIVADLVCAIAGLVIAFCVLPRQWRSLAVVVVVDYSIIFGYVVSGDIAIFAFPALVLVAWRWSEVGAGGHLGWRGGIGAAAMGVAIATTQLAWFVAPFVVVGIVICRRRELGSRAAAAVVARYLAIAAGVFLAINAPFIIQGPGAWVAGILGPLTQHAIPYGQGVIDLADFAGVGGGNLELYTLGAVAVYAGLLGLFMLRFDRLWRGALMLPVIALWFPTRSLAEYWMTLIGVWVVAIAATNPPRPATRHWSLRGWRPPAWALSGLLVPAVAVLGLAITTPSPLRLDITSVRTNGQLEHVWRVRARVTNTSSTRLTPHYATDSIGQMTSFWRVISGPETIAPNSSAVVTLEAPNVGSMPGITSRFQLEAVTSSPETVSVSAPYTAEPYTLAMSPGSFAPVPLGTPVHIALHLRSTFGAPVHKAGVPVFLGQVIYGQDNLIPSEAAINGRPQGQSPVEARTNASGVANFDVVATTQQGSPLYFQAWATGTGGFPFGYSPVVSVTWTGSRSGVR